MTDDAPLRFNALTDPWLPLVQVDGTTVWASFVEVLAGEKDGADLDYPRDDFRVFARLLLSALIQALFPAKNKAELVQRLETPMRRADIETRIAPVLEDFELFGPKPFLQIVAPSKIPKIPGAAPFVFPAEDLRSTLIPLDRLSLPIALVTLFSEHTFAGGAGSGHGTGPAGQLGVLTLIDVGSVRASAWANTLSREVVTTKYAKEDPTPWSNEKRTATRRDGVGLVTGLFFQPRGMWLIPAEHGVCSFCGKDGPRVRRSLRLSKSELATKSSGGEDLWQHPCAPLAVNSQGIAPIRLNADQPAWMGLAQLLRPISKNKTKKQHPNEGPAPVLQQWKTLGRRGTKATPKLLVLYFDRDKANVKRRFFEAYPLTELLADRVEVVEILRAILEDAEVVQRRLTKALTSAHDDQRRGGFALRDAEAEFWRESEPSFLRLLASLASCTEWNAGTEQMALDRGDEMKRRVRRAAITIFDSHVELSEFDPSKAARVAKARRSLTSDLYKQLGPQRPSTGDQVSHAAT
jgi:CRISPR type I-E-associated protein CasA/Cse1